MKREKNGNLNIEGLSALFVWLTLFSSFYLMFMFST